MFSLWTGTLRGVSLVQQFSNFTVHENHLVSLFKKHISGPHPRNFDLLDNNNSKHLLYIYHVPSTIISTLLVWTVLILTTTICGSYYCHSYFIDEEPDAQNDWYLVNYLLTSWWWSLDVHPGSWLQSLLPTITRPPLVQWSSSLWVPQREPLRQRCRCRQFIGLMVPETQTSKQKSEAGKLCINELVVGMGSQGSVSIGTLQRTMKSMP